MTRIFTTNSVYLNALSEEACGSDGANASPWLSNLFDWEGRLPSRPTKETGAWANTGAGNNGTTRRSSLRLDGGLEPAAPSPAEPCLPWGRLGRQDRQLQ